MTKDAWHLPAPGASRVASLPSDVTAVRRSPAGLPRPGTGPFYDRRLKTITILF
jgi:hypothetical protein